MIDFSAHYYDVECPYCHAGNNINHDGNYGYEEYEEYSQECNKCNKVFAFITSISFSYDVNQADCLNGEEHRWVETQTWLQCHDCRETKSLPIEKLRELIEKEKVTNL